MTMREAIDALASEFALTDDERQQVLPSGRQTTFANRVHWAKAYLSKSGLVDTPGRGRLRISPAGRSTLAEGPERIDRRYLERFGGYQAFTAKPTADKIDEVVPRLTQETALSPEELIRSARVEIETALASELLSAVVARPPAFFERLIIQLLVAMGYGGSLADAGRAIGRSGDGGVDGVIDEDALGLDRVYVQAKRYKAENAVGSSAVRDFFGALDAVRANKGLFVTTSSFSPQAVQTAANLSKRIVLVDGARLTELMIRHDVGVRVIDTVPIKTIDEDYFDAD